MSWNTKIPKFRRFVLQNFPFIEEDFDALTDYELICKVVEYLNTVIQSQNELITETESFESSVTNEINTFESNITSDFEELEGLFNTLKNYVDNYFDNLDVQEEIDHKLDEMVEDGTMTTILSGYFHVGSCYDTVSSMKADQYITVNSYLRTMGYHSKNDGGSGLYYVVDDNSLATDDGSVIALDNNLKAVLVYSDSIRLSQFGIDATHTTNLTNFIAFVNASTKISTIIFESGVVYPLDTVMEFSKADLKIVGNGATIAVSNTVKRSDLFKITTTNSCIINNIIINGDSMPQDQWDIQVYANMSFRTCFRITSPNIFAANIRIKDVWGQGLQLYGYETVTLENCVFDKIGGDFWYHDAETSTFDNIGDAVYLSGHSKDADVNISNCIFIGYENTDSTKNDSRCGIVFENLAGYTMTDLITNLHVTNTIIKNFSRPLHHEAYQSLTHMYFNNCELLKASCFMASNRTYTDLVIDNSTITYHNKIAYLGSSSLRYMNARVNKCTITLPDDVDNGLGHDSNVIYKDCIINNVTKRLNTGSVNCELINCTLNFSENYVTSTYLTANSAMIYRNCTFNMTTQTLSTNVASGQISYIYSCTFNNIFPTFRPVFSDFGSILNLTSEPNNLTYYTRRIYANGKVTVNNVLVSVPNMGGCVSANEEANTDGNTTYTAFNSTSLPIIPATLPANVVLKRNTKYLMMMYGTNDSVFKYNTTFENFYYTDLTFNTSGNASIGTINTHGTIPANNALTFDTSGGTVAQSGTLASNYLTWILPYEYKEKLGL